MLSQIPLNNGYPPLPWKNTHKTPQKNLSQSSFQASKKKLPPKKATCYPKISPFLLSQICPSNHICRDSHLPTPLLCSLPKALLQRPDNLLHAAGFSPSNNSQKWFLSDFMMTRVDPGLAFKSTTLIPWWPIREWHVAKYAAANQATHGGLQICPSSVEFTNVKNMNTGVKGKCE